MKGKKVFLKKVIIGHIKIFRNYKRKHSEMASKKELQEIGTERKKFKKY